MTEQRLAKELGDNLKSAMDEYGVTQKELSELTGISKSMISKYVNGELVPTLKNLINIAYALECEINEFADAYDRID